MNTKKLLIIICIIANQFINTAKAQAPQSFNYQAIARDASGAVLSNQAVSFRISLLQGSAIGTSTYTETHTVTTNLLGLVNFAIGGGTLVSGNFASINWAQGPYFIQIELDATNSGTYVIMNTTQLLSVPYSLASNNVTIQSPNGTYWKLNVDNVGNLSTTNINCVPVYGFNGYVSDSLSAGSSYHISPVSVQGTIPYSYNWSITPNDSTILIQNSTSNNPTLYVTHNINPGTSYNLQATVSNCNGSNSMSQTFPITVTAPICPNALNMDSSEVIITSNCNIIGGYIQYTNSNQLYFHLFYANNYGCSTYGYYDFIGNVNCLNHTINIPNQNIIYGYCSGGSSLTGTISGSGTFNNTLSQMTITVNTIINSVSNTCTTTFSHN